MSEISVSRSKGSVRAAPPPCPPPVAAPPPSLLSLLSDAAVDADPMSLDAASFDPDSFEAGGVSGGFGEAPASALDVSCFALAPRDSASSPAPAPAPSP